MGIAQPSPPASAMQTPPHFASALSTQPDSVTAEREVTDAVLEGLQGRSPDLVAVFVTHHHGPALEELGQRLARDLGTEVVIGCTGESIIGPGREIEGSSALSVWAACLPGTAVRPFRMQSVAGTGGTHEFSGQPVIEEQESASLLLFGDPFSFPMDEYLKLLNRDFPGVPAVGGMASGGQGPGQNLLITEQGLVSEGALGLVLEGAVEVRSVVSQGCRPVGKPWVVTACEEHMIKRLGGKPALEVLMETLREIDPSEQNLFKRQPFIGLAMDPTKSSFDRSDFLVRTILGFQPQERAIAVADLLRRGQTIQFLVRDAASASEDLELLLHAQAGGALPADADPHSAGALIFSCNGRGSRMFDRPHHDVTQVAEALHTELPVAGFFAMGEIGPVGAENYLHGFTASVAVFRQRA